MGGRVRVDVVLVRPSTVAGVVRRGTEPVVQYPVRLDRAPSSPFPSGHRNAHTDKDGHYRLADQAPGEAWLQIGSEGYGAAYSLVKRRIEIKEGVDLVCDFDLPAVGAIVDGTVLLDGVPPPGGTACVKIDSLLGQSTVATRLSPEGEYRLEGTVPRGRSPDRFRGQSRRGQRQSAPRSLPHRRRGSHTPGLQSVNSGERLRHGVGRSRE